MLWQVYVFPRPGQPDLDARRVAQETAELKIAQIDQTHSARGYLIDGELGRDEVTKIAIELLADPVIETFAISDSSGELQSCDDSPVNERLASLSAATVLLKPGVMDPVAQSVEQVIRRLGLSAQVRTFRRYWLSRTDSANVREKIASRVLANDAIEQVVWGPLKLDHLAFGTSYRFELIRLPIRGMSDSDLEQLSREGQLSLNLSELRTIQQHFQSIGRDPSDAELETIAQTWSEHCSHKTLRGRIDYEEIDGGGNVTRREHFDNLLKETIFKATKDIRNSLGPECDWCVSVFEDNAGIVRFDDKFNVCFKVETHNHPSAIEPYGGANTGLGGVLRDSMGTGLGAKPVANTDIFCFAPPDFPGDEIPPGVLHPKRVMRGVVAGVRDYGNRMGIPTVNGAIFFDARYLANPLVFCGNVGLIPRSRSQKRTKPGDLIVSVGGRTGRDGIHGATFSSIELTHESEQLSGGAVQIGNAITQKMMLDVILQARDAGLFHAITDCGAGGFSSAVGEMGASIGAEVWLDRVPLKYHGLSYSEIWISEAQERMVLAVPESNWAQFEQLCKSEDVEATRIGRFQPTGRLTLKYQEHVVADLDMHFLHEGRPPVVRKAVWKQGKSEPSKLDSFARNRLIELDAPVTLRTLTEAAGVPATQVIRKMLELNLLVPINESLDDGTAIRLAEGLGIQLRIGKAASASVDSEPQYNEPLKRILSSWNVCSKEWVIRQYDHEVQGGSVVKPLVGAENDGPSDAAVVRPVLGSNRGLAIACGMNPLYGDIDPYWMAASAIDEAIRNCVAVGADPERIAILDNFCWGNTDRPEELGKLVRAAVACRDIATAYGTPFISGKDSLNNEFRVPDKWLQRPGVRASNRIVIPATLLISALGQVDNVYQCVTMDLKEPDNVLCVVGFTANELGGSHYSLLGGGPGGQSPRVDDPVVRRQLFRHLHRLIKSGLVRSCHDLSEGGLAIAAAEMSLAGGLGAELFFGKMPTRAAVRAMPNDETRDPVLLFSESNSRFLVEVRPSDVESFLGIFDDEGYTPDGPIAAEVGRVRSDEWLMLAKNQSSAPAVRMALGEIKECWQRPLRW